MVTIKKETVEDISQLKEITGKNDEEIVTSALKAFIKNHSISITGTVAITFFGVAFHIGHLIGSTNF